MVGLSVVLEPHENATHCSTTTTKNTVLPLVQINNILKPSASRTPPCFHLRAPAPAPWADVSSFLEACFLCRLKLLPSKDIYMYKGDTAFCSEECRAKHIITEEQAGEGTSWPHHHRRRADGIGAAGRFRC